MHQVSILSSAPGINLVNIADAPGINLINLADAPANLFIHHFYCTRYPINTNPRDSTNTTSVG
jgi:hypothetical protein